MTKHEGSAGQQPRLRGIRLRQVVEGDLPFLFRLLADPWRAHHWMNLREVHDERKFCETWIDWGREWMDARLLIERNGRPIGLCFDYARAPEDGHTCVSVVLEASQVGGGAGVIACALFHDWLLKALPLRKIYHEVYSSHASVLRMHRRLGSVEEAVLRVHRFFDGAYWDLHKIAIYREAWPKMRDRILRTRSEQRGGRRTTDTKERSFEHAS